MRAALVGVGLGLAALAGCGGSAPTVVHGKPVAHWVAALHDPSPKLRRRAALALGNAGTADPAAVPALAEAVRDHDPAVRRAAVLCLLRIGPGARAAVPALEEAAHKDRDTRVRADAARALKTIQAGP